MTTLLSIINVFLLVLLAQSVYSHHQKLAHLKEAVFNMMKNFEGIKREHSALVTADLVFAKRLKDINNQLTGIDNQVQALANKRNNDGGYQHALRILKMGGDKHEIISSCNLSSAEADLIMNLHAYSTALEKAV